MIIYTVEIQTRFGVKTGLLHKDRLNGRCIGNMLGKTVKINTHSHDGLPTKTVGILLKVTNSKNA